MNILEYKKEQRIFALFIGRSGSGKSAAAASMPQPMQELDFDLRANGIINCIEQRWLKNSDIDIKQFDPMKGYIQVQDHLNLLYTWAGINQLNFKSIDIGSLTSLIRLLELTSLNAPAGSGIGHINLSGLTITGPADYKFESQAMHKIIDFLRVLPCNITVSAHIVDKYGKRPGAKDMDPQTIVGEKLTVTANLAENILAMFNDVYKFTKEMINGEPQYFVEFNSEIAKNSFSISAGKFPITRKEFWPYLQELIAKAKTGDIERPKPTGGLIYS